MAGEQRPDSKKQLNATSCLMRAQAGIHLPLMIRGKRSEDGFLAVW